jgi:hypothetical protein
MPPVASGELAGSRRGRRRVGVAAERNAGRRATSDSPTPVEDRRDDRHHGYGGGGGGHNRALLILGNRFASPARRGADLLDAGQKLRKDLSAVVNLPLRPRSWRSRGRLRAVMERDRAIPRVALPPTPTQQGSCRCYYFVSKGLNSRPVGSVEQSSISCSAEYPPAANWTAFAARVRGR